MVFVPKVSVSVSLRGLRKMNIPVFHRGQSEKAQSRGRLVSLLQLLVSPILVNPENTERRGG